MAVARWGGVEPLKAELKKRYDAAHARYEEVLKAWIAETPKQKKKPSKPSHKLYSEPHQSRMLDDIEIDACSELICSLLFVDSVSVDAMLFQVTPLYWWEVCGVQHRRPQNDASAAASVASREREMIKAALQALSALPKTASVSQVREETERRLGTLHFNSLLCCLLFRVFYFCFQFVNALVRACVRFSGIQRKLTSGVAGRVAGC